MICYYFLGHLFLWRDVLSIMCSVLASLNFLKWSITFFLECCFDWRWWHGCSCRNQSLEEFSCLAGLGGGEGGKEQINSLSLLLTSLPFADRRTYTVWVSIEGMASVVFNHNFERSNPQRASFGNLTYISNLGLRVPILYLQHLWHLLSTPSLNKKSLALTLINFHVAFVNGLLLRVELTQYEL